MKQLKKDQKAKGAPAEYKRVFRDDGDVTLVNAKQK